MSDKYTKTFPYSMEVAWKALHKSSELDVDSGSRIEKISDDEWDSYLLNSEGEDISKTHFSTTYDESIHKVTIEGVSNKKHEHDFIYLTLSEIDEQHVSLNIDIEISTGIHMIAHLLLNVLGSHMKKILADGIFENFDALCSGKATKRKNQKELSEIAETEISKKLKEK